MKKNDKISRRLFPDILAIHKDLENMAESMIRCQTFLDRQKFENMNKVVIRNLTKWRPLARRLASCKHARENSSLSPITAISCILNCFIGFILILTSFVYI